MIEGIDLRGRVAAITAGAGGLGAYAALSLAACGADIAIGDIDHEQAAKTVAAIEALGRRALFVEMNALHCEQVGAFIARVAEDFGSLDILINNAGGSTRRNFMDSAEKSWRKHIEINFVSMLAATFAAASVMQAQGRPGVIINVASVEGMRGSPGLAVYAACKAAMINFSRSMAVELANLGIRVIALAPDIIRTAGMTRFGVDAPEMATARERYIPLRRMGNADDYGALIAFLCSDFASYLTGITIPIDGGSTAAAGFQRSAAAGEWQLLRP